MTPERRAWYVLLGAFSIFLILCGAIIFGLQYLVFKSTQALEIQLSVASGTALIQEGGDTEAVAVTEIKNSLLPVFNIQTDINSQVNLDFEDPEVQTTIASVRIFKDTDVLFTEALTRRYPTGNTNPVITLDLRNGACDIRIGDTTEKDVHVNVNFNGGYAILSEPGEYYFTASENSILVDPNAHNVDIVSTTGSKSSISERTRIIVSDDTLSLAEIPAQELITNGDFDIPLEVGWSAYNDAQTSPEGFLATEIRDNFTDLIIDRSQSNWPDILLGHGETGVTQTINKNLVNINELVVRVSFLIEEQSLALCGERGSECPVMIKLDYQNPTGEDRVFITGFYAYTAASYGYPVTCDSCRTEHTRVNFGTWYRYDSGNLIDRLPGELRPDFIKSITVYASGHAYRVRIGDVSLVSR